MYEININGMFVMCILLYGVPIPGKVLPRTDNWLQYKFIFNYLYYNANH